MSRVSFWLVPEACDRKVFQTLIQVLAERYGSVPFLPHVTLYGGPCQAMSVLDALLERAVRGVPPFALETDGLRHSAVFSKTVFVQLRPTDACNLLASRLRRALPDAADYRFDPHLSLIYKNLDEATRQTLVETLVLPRAIIRFDEVQAIESSDSFRSQADVQSLRCLSARPLAAR